MSLSELEPVVRTLPRSEKFQLVQFLVNELAREDDAAVQLMAEHGTFPVWTPLHAESAAQTLMHALDAGRISA
ncbi:MAG: hypothetical protein ACKV2Q_01725 [Planctomycetaceae bacterium]